MTDKEMVIFLLDLITKIIFSLNLIHNTTNDISIKMSMLQIIDRTNKELKSAIK